MKHEESRMQMACVLWFDLQYPQYSDVLISIPNGGERPKKTVRLKNGTYKTFSPEGERLKKEGLREGASDLVLLIARHGYGALCLEGKTKTGRQSPKQKKWQKSVEAAGNKYVLFRSIEEFISTINSYISKT